MGDSPPTGGKGRCAQPATDSFRQDYRPTVDHQPRHALEIGDDHRRRLPLLVEAREIIAVFHAMVRRKSQLDLDPWLDRARASLVAPFANGVVKDKAAVEAAIDLPWSNGQTEGQITKLKLVKRQMYGRGKLDLLQARMLGAN